MVISEYNSIDEDQSFMNVDPRPSSPLQMGDENSYYGSEDGTARLSTPQETSRSSVSEDLSHVCADATPKSMEYECSDDENLQNRPPSTSSSHKDGDSCRKSGSGQGSSGKVKTYKCRSCDFSATEKFDLFRHVEVHMKPEKVLRCLTCPFVTEYKHHMDFHNFNHDGQKPYQCDQCSYCCVNKSMLKSHQKSHSSVYRFNCRDCTYRTKYCHSLKIHLRKYTHSPGLVLDSDGKPDPNPTIDVYGNRRGPRQKPKKSDTNQSTTRTTRKTSVVDAAAAAAAAAAAPAATLPLQTTIPPLSTFSNLTWQNRVFFTENSRLPPCQILSKVATMNAPHPAFCNKDVLIASHEIDNFHNNNNIKVNNNNNNNNNDNSNISKNDDINSRSSGSSYISNNNNNDSDNEDFSSRIKPRNLNNNNNNNSNNNNNNNNSNVNNLNCTSINDRSSFLPCNTTNSTTARRVKRYSRSDDEDIFQPSETNSEEAQPTAVDIFVPAMSSIPLSLSLPLSLPLPLPLPLPPSFDRSAPLAEIQLGSQVEELPLNLTKTLNLTETHVVDEVKVRASKNRRKGPAYKLKRAAVVKTEEVDKVDSAASTMTTTTTTTLAAAAAAVQTKAAPHSANVADGPISSELLSKLKNKKSYYCDFCEITFFSYVMFTMHMGHHGHSDPFTCNRCGKKTGNSIEFYGHIISDAH